MDLSKKPTLKEVQEQIRKEGEKPIILPKNIGETAPETLADTLATEFAKIVLPSWVFMILLESGIVSTLIGIEMYFQIPLILVFGGLVQVVPTAFILLRRIQRAKKA